MESGPVILHFLRADGELICGVPFRRHLLVGRDACCDVVIPDGRISKHHALLWAADGVVWIKDIGSRNGVFFQGSRIQRVQRLPLHAAVCLADAVWVQVAQMGGRERAMGVEVIGSGLQRPIRNKRLLLGATQQCELLLEGVSQPAELVQQAGGGFALQEGGQTRPIADGALFSVGHHHLRLRALVAPSPVKPVHTDALGEEFRYRLSIQLQRSPPHALIEDPSSETSCWFYNEVPLYLLCVLGQKLQKDRERGLPPDQQGWCTNAEILTGVWGREEVQKNIINVAIYRLRRQLIDSGLDARCIERKKRRTRILSRDVIIA